jgi:flagellar biosynthesis/type III secretory pathway protein FliH
VAWFDQRRQKQLFLARFDDVTPRQRRQPSWLAKARGTSNPAGRVTVPPPPAIPNELDVGNPRIEQMELHDDPSKSESGREGAPRSSNEPSRPSMTPAELEGLVAERAAKQAAEKALRDSQSAILKAVQTLVSAHQQLSDELSARTVELAVLVARRVVARELLTQPDIVTDLVREGLDVLNARDRVRVHLGPQFAVLKDELVAYFAAMGTMLDVTLDSTLPPYGCVVETELGSVDESIESRLSTLLDSLTADGDT